LQKDVLAAAWDIFGSRFPDFERFNTGIVKRHGVKPLTTPRSSATSRATGSNSALGSQQS
jgi:hypothetical protein